jgi:hypothetical protein
MALKCFVNNEIIQNCSIIPLFALENDLPMNMGEDKEINHEKLDKIIQQKTNENEALKRLITELEKKPAGTNNNKHQPKK